MFDGCDLRIVIWCSHGIPENSTVTAIYLCSCGLVVVWKGFKYSEGSLHFTSQHLSGESGRKKTRDWTQNEASFIFCTIVLIQKKNVLEFHTLIDGAVNRFINTPRPKTYMDWTRASCIVNRLNFKQTRPKLCMSKPTLSMLYIRQQKTGSTLVNFSRGGKSQRVLIVSCSLNA